MAVMPPCNGRHDVSSPCNAAIFSKPFPWFSRCPLAGCVSEWRCDLHPRTSNDGNFVCIDSTHGGNGRQPYLLDLRPVWAEVGR